MWNIIGGIALAAIGALVDANDSDNRRRIAETESNNNARVRINDSNNNAIVSGVGSALAAAVIGYGIKKFTERPNDSRQVNANQPQQLKSQPLQLRSKN